MNETIELLRIAFRKGQESIRERVISMDGPELSEAEVTAILKAILAP